MQQTLHTADYLVFLFYFIVVSVYGYWIYQRKKMTGVCSSYPNFVGGL